MSALRYLDGQKHEIKTAFIKKITVDTTEENNQVVVTLKNEEDTYTIGGIKASEHNLNTLWEIYENNEEVELVFIDHGIYKVIKILGLFVAAIVQE